VGAGDVFGVEPDVVGAGVFEGDEVVLAVVAADEDGSAVGGGGGEGGGWRRGPLFAAFLYIAGLDEFLADFADFFQGGGVVEGDGDGIEVGEVGAALGELGGEDVASPFGFGVFGVVTPGVGKGGEEGVVGDGERRRPDQGRRDRGG